MQSQKSLTQDKNTSLLNQSLSKNLLFHALIENEVNETLYGTITFNVEVIGGVVKLSTINVVKNRRKRYKLTKT